MRAQGLRVERVPNGTNVFRVALPLKKAQGVRTCLAREGVNVSLPAQHGDEAVFSLLVNESWNRITGDRLAGMWINALRES
jgi:hypothetical protein